MQPRRSRRGAGPEESKEVTEPIRAGLRSIPSRRTRQSNASLPKSRSTSPEDKPPALVASKQKPSEIPTAATTTEEAERKPPARKSTDKAASGPAETVDRSQNTNSNQKATNAVLPSRRSRRFSVSTSDKEEEAPTRSTTRRSARHSAASNNSGKTDKGKDASAKEEEVEDESASDNENETLVAKKETASSANGKETNGSPILGKRKAPEEGTRDAKKVNRTQQAKTGDVPGDGDRRDDNADGNDKSDDEDGIKNATIPDDGSEGGEDGTENGTVPDDGSEGEEDGTENGTLPDDGSEGEKDEEDGTENGTLPDDGSEGEEDGIENDTVPDGENRSGNEDEIAEAPPPRRSHRSREKKTGSRKLPNELDEGTLQAVKTYLADNINGDEVLDEVEMVAFMVRMDRAATEQTRYQQKLVGDSDEEDDELYCDILAEEEEHALGQSFFKSVVHKVKKQDDDLTLDKGTLDWIRRAAGLQKNNNVVHSRQTANASREPGVAGTRMSARRYTRGMATNSRTQKRKKDMRHLTDAVDELEKEFGPFERTERKIPEKRKREPRRSVSPYQADDDEPSSRSAKRKKKSALVARMPMPKKARRGIIDTGSSTRDVRVSKVLVDGEHISRGTNDWDVFKAELIKEREREYQVFKAMAQKEKRQARRENGGSYRRAARRAARRESRDSRREADRQSRRIESFRDDRDSIILRKPPVEAPLSLALHDWQRRDLISKISKDRETESLTEMEYQKRLKKTLPASYTEAGIVYRLPGWKAMNPAASGASYRTPFDPPRVRHSDEVYASCCHKLVTVLQGSARTWAVCEFFYSDLDKAWYNRSKFTEDVAKLGVPPGALFTRREWTAIRRRIPNKPRRFTQRFIASQLNDRNKYRNTVRMLQRNVDLASSLRFQYDVPAPIRVGNIVTAYNRKYRVIHRGAVLSYDERSARYLVQFERKEFGHDFCPDTEVASHGIPDLLIRAPERILTASVTGVAADPNNDNRNLPCTSSYGPVPGITSKPDAAVTDGLSNLFPFRPLAFQGARRNDMRSEGKSRECISLLEEVAEREAFVTLMSCIETASARKKMLLNAMEDFNAHMAQRLPFGDDSSVAPAMPPQEKRHYTWLLANLEQTNRLLERALSSLRSMYGDAYLPSTNDSVNRLELMERALGDMLPNREDLPPMALPWIVELVVGAEDLGETIVASCLQPETRAEKEKQENERTLFMRSRLASVGELLLTASYGQGKRKGPSTANNTTIATALAIGANKLVSTDLPPAPFHGQDLYAEMMATRDLAVKDLQEAVDLLNAELAASSAKQALET